MTEEAYRERIAQAVQLLEGDFAAVEQQLREQMECASEELRFEAAAEYRDRIKAIQLLGSRQKVVASLRADVDVCGLFLGDAKSCFTVLHFLAGDLAGRDTELWSPLWRRTGEEVLSALVKQYYGGRGRLPLGDSASVGSGGSGGASADVHRGRRSKGGGARAPAGGPRRNSSAWLSRMPPTRQSGPPPGRSGRIS